jgi:hypothetical protein
MPSKEKDPQDPPANQPSPSEEEDDIPMAYEPAAIGHQIGRAQYLLMKTDAIAAMVRTVGIYHEDFEVQVCMDVINDFLTQAQHHLEAVEGACTVESRKQRGWTPPTAEEDRS